jgi:predicted amidohydrolase YtcJ
MTDPWRQAGWMSAILAALPESSQPGAAVSFDLPADIVLTGGHVFTSDGRRPRAEAVAVGGGRIAAVGTVAEVRGHVGSRTRVIDLAGRLLVPGFQDAHIHALDSGLGRLGCNLHQVAPAGFATHIAEYAASHPDATWIQGEGWPPDAFAGALPDREALDAVVPDRPALLYTSDGHIAWVNSKALELAGIGARTPDPPGGRIERRADGEPQGTLHESAIWLVADLVPPATADEREAVILGVQRELHGFGLTAWQEMSVEPPEIDAWQTVEARGLLTGRVVGAIRGDPHRGPPFAELVSMRARTAGGRFRATHVKLFQDGIIENRTAALIEPYHEPDGRLSNERGDSIHDPAALGDLITRLDSAGFHTHVHAVGERAVRETLDAFEAARLVNGPSGLRHQIAHIQVIHPADVPRFAELEVIANAQPYWAVHESQMDRMTIPVLGEERSRWQYPFRSLVDAGARLAMGSDWSVSTPNPLREIEVAVTRIDDEHRGERAPFLPEQRLDLATAIRAFTIGSAFANGLEAETGSIEVGKAADLVLIDRDLFESETGPIGDGRVLLTLIDGEPVHEDPSLGG